MHYPVVVNGMGVDDGSSIHERVKAAVCKPGHDDDKTEWPTSLNYDCHMDCPCDPCSDVSKSVSYGTESGLPEVNADCRSSDPGRNQVPINCKRKVGVVG